MSKSLNILRIDASTDLLGWIVVLETDDGQRLEMHISIQDSLKIVIQRPTFVIQRPSRS